MKTNITKEQLANAMVGRTEGETAEFLGVSRATVSRAKRIYGMYKPYTAYLQDVTITDRQKQILYGKLLGDGHARIAKGGRNAYIRIEQGELQKEYVEWLYTELESFTKKNGIKKSVRKFTSYYFDTMCIPPITFLYTNFYKDGRRVLPEDFEDYLNPLTLAVWYLDDGTNYSNQYKVTICLHAFNPVECGRIISTMKHKFGLKNVKAVPAYKEKPFEKLTLYISGREDVTKLLNIIIPEVKEIESLKYKIIPLQRLCTKPLFKNRVKR